MECASHATPSTTASGAWLLARWSRTKLFEPASQKFVSGARRGYRVSPAFWYRRDSSTSQNLSSNASLLTRSGVQNTRSLDNDGRMLLKKTNQNQHDKFNQSCLPRQSGYSCQSLLRKLRDNRQEAHEASFWWINRKQSEPLLHLAACLLSALTMRYA